MRVARTSTSRAAVHRAFRLLTTAVLLGLYWGSTAASAFELAAGGTYYVQVIAGNSPGRLELWGVGPSRNPLHLGRFEGKIAPGEASLLGTFQQGQDLYMWYELTDTATGTHQSVDSKNKHAYKVGLDPRGGYRVEVASDSIVESTDAPYLVLWVYPGRAVSQAPSTPESRLAAQNAVVGALALQPANGAPVPAAVGISPPSPALPAGPPLPSRQTTGAWRWLVAELMGATVLMLGYQRMSGRSSADKLNGLADLDLVTRAVNLGRAGQVDEAVALLEPLIDPEVRGEASELAVSQLADIYLQAGKVGAALALLRDRPFDHLTENQLSSLCMRLESQGHADAATRLRASITTGHGSSTAADHDLAATVMEYQPPVLTRMEVAEPTVVTPVLEVVRPAAADSFGVRPEDARGLAAQVDAEMAAEIPASAKIVLEPMVLARKGSAEVAEGLDVPAAHAAVAVPTGWNPLDDDARPEEPVVAAAPTVVSPMPMPMPMPMPAPIVTPAPAPMPKSIALPVTTASPAPAPLVALTTPPAPIPLPRVVELVPQVVSRSRSMLVETPMPGTEPLIEPSTDNAAIPSILRAWGEHHPTGLLPEFRNLSNANPVTPEKLPPPIRPCRSRAMSIDQLATIEQRLLDRFGGASLVHSDPLCALYSCPDPEGGTVPVSVHVLSPALASEVTIVTEFIRDMKAFGSSEHPALLKVKSVHTNPLVCVVTEGLPAPLISGMLRGKPLQLHAALSISQQMADALDQMHRQGIIHGDIRPSRVVGGYLQPLRLLPPILPRISTAKLRALLRESMERDEYQPPEASGNQMVDYLGDIYGIGMMIHEMVTGSMPVRAHQSEGAEMLMPSRWISGLPESLDALVARCLKKDPSARHQDCGVVRQVLTDLAGDQTAWQRMVLGYLADLEKLANGSLDQLLERLNGIHDMPGTPVAARAFWSWLKNRGLRDTIAGPVGVLQIIGTLSELEFQYRMHDQRPTFGMKPVQMKQLGMALEGLLALAETSETPETAQLIRIHREGLELTRSLARLREAIAKVVAIHTLDYAPLLSEVVERHTDTTVRIEMPEVSPEVRSRFCEPRGQVHQKLQFILEGVLAETRRCGATLVRIGAEIQEDRTRVKLSIVDDASMGRGAEAGATPSMGTSTELDRVRQVLDGIGGRILLSTRPGQGTEYRISLPGLAA